MSGNAKATRILTALLVVMFGTSTWVALGGLWVELPLLTNLGVPEGYQINCYVILITQAAAIGPMIFVALQYLSPLKRYHLEIPTIYAILAVGLIASFLLIFVWDAHTVWPIDMQDHSTALLVLCFFMALVDSTSNLTFMPFVSSLRAEYISWYFIGEGLSSVIPSLVVLVQGEGGVDNCVSGSSYLNMTFDQVTNTTIVQNCTEMIVERDGAERFPPKYYYSFIFLLFLSSAVSFGLLRCLPLLQDQYEKFHNEEDGVTARKSNEGSLLSWRCCFSSCVHSNEDPEKTPLLSNPERHPKIEKHQRIVVTEECDSPSNHDQEAASQNNPPDMKDRAPTGESEIVVSPVIDMQETSLENISNSNQLADNIPGKPNHDSNTDVGQKMSSSSFACSAKYVFLFAVLSVVSAATYGILPSIQSYSAGAYGQGVYLLVAACAEISVPIGFVLVMIRPSTSYLVVLLTSLGGLVAGAFCMATAVLSPEPPLLHHAFGKFIIILAWILQGLFFSYCRATIGWILRGEENTRLLLMIFGGCTTLGTMVGALIMFPLVTAVDIFQEFDPSVACSSNLTCVNATEYDSPNMDAFFYSNSIRHV